MKPDAFQFGVSGWAVPSLFVHRTMREWEPFLEMVKCVSHWRKPYLPLSLPSFAGCQVLPPSAEKSILATPVSPPNAMPRASVSEPARTDASALKFVMKDSG